MGCLYLFVGTVVVLLTTLAPPKRGTDRIAAILVAWNDSKSGVVRGYGDEGWTPSHVIV